jgi:toxin ParE1/3/4
MVSKPVRFHPEGEQEYLSSLAWYYERSLSAAFDFDDEVEQAVSATKSPERWPMYVSQCRRYVLHQFPFSLVYRDLENEVFVLAVAHGHRRPGYWRKRLR